MHAIPLVLGQSRADHEPLPTFLRVTAYTERGTFYRRAWGRWTADQREEEAYVTGAAFGAELRAEGCQRIQVVTRVFVEWPLFGWCEVEM